MELVKADQRLTSIGTPIIGAQTVADALEQGGIDWKVELRPVGVKSSSGNHFVRIPDRYANVRTSDDRPLGIVGSRYVPFQNDEALAFADNLVHGGGRFESVFEQRHGAVVGLTMRFPEHISVGGIDPVDLYLILRTTHDGSGCVRLGVSGVRAGCTNQLNAIFRSAKATWKVSHTRSAEARLQDARRSLELTLAYGETFQSEMDQLIAREVTEKDIDRMLESVLGKQRLGEKALVKEREAILELVDGSPTLPAEYRRTAWGVYNAVAEHYDWQRPYRTADARDASLLWGRAAKAKTAMLDAVRELAAV